VIEPVDPEMLLEGPVVVFGLRLPEGAVVRGQHVTLASVSVPHAMELVSSYLRARVQPDSVDTGPDKTVFVGARRNGSSPADPTLKIVVTRTTVGTDLLIKRESPKGDFPIHAPANGSADVAGAQKEPGRPEEIPSSMATLLPKPPPPPQPD